MSFKPQFSRVALATPSLVIALALTGCAQVLTPMGSDKYDCNRKEDPTSPYCRSFKAVERGTSGAVPASRFDETLHLAEHDRLTGIAPTNTGRSPSGEPATGSAPATPAANRLAPGSDIPDAPVLAALQGRPVRQAPLVQRVWVKRFADGNDMLVGSTYVYKEILPTRWSGVSSVVGAGGAAKADARGAFPHRPPMTLGIGVSTRCSAGARTDDAAGSATCSSTANDASTVPSQPLPADVLTEGVPAGSMPR